MREFEVNLKLDDYQLEQVICLFAENSLDCDNLNEFLEKFAQFALDNEIERKYDFFKSCI